MRRRQRTEDGGIDISPLIDVVFILLIFFMVSTTFVKDMELDLERPSASSGAAAASDALRVYIDRDSNLYVDTSPVQAWMLQSRVRDHLRDTPESPVLIITDRGVPAERLIEAVDQCRMAGAKDVGVVTDAEAG